MWNDANLIKVLNQGEAVVMPTDTLYGIVGKALDAKAVERIYELRKRNPEKPCIILIGDVSELDKFSIKLTEKQKEILNNYWPGPVSIVLDCSDERFSYLHRGTKTLAFRMPEPEALRGLLMKTGPLIAPSANLEGLPPAQNIDEARKYFGDGVFLYIDAGDVSGKASRVVRLHLDGSLSIVR